MGLDKSRLHRESAFGPPSKEIPVLDFIQNASKVQQSIRDSTKEGWDAIEQSERNSISEELGLGDIQAITDRIFLHKNYPDIFKKIYEQYTVKRKENDSPPSPYLKDDFLTQMISDMDQSPLKHWPPPKGAIHYFRKNRRTELNSLSQVTAATPSASTAITPEAIVTISFYSQPTKGSNRNESWVNVFILDAVCAFPASQTLQTVFEHLSCTTEDNSTQGLESLSYGGNEVERGLYGIVLENTVFGGGVGNWAHQFQQVCNTSQCESQVANNTMLQTKLLDLRLKVQHPYWIYHKGNCIHCWLVEGVRLASSTDINCPMMLHKGTRPHPTCHHCGRNPVTLAVNGDTRLGESPSRICGECWDAMGGRQNNDSVVIHLALSTIERPLV